MARTCRGSGEEDVLREGPNFDDKPDKDGHRDGPGASGTGYRKVALQTSPLIPRRMRAASWLSPAFGEQLGMAIGRAILPG
jgi:hypothetical protein